MPLYEYQCPECGTFERVQKFSDPILTACPTCGSPVEKLPSAPAIQFKGSGWYVTDYASKGNDNDKGKGKDKDKDKDKDKSPGETKANDTSAGKDTSGSKSEGTRKDSSSSSKADKGTSSS